ncbi:hypothetical protein EZH22_24385 [Xanthobacter dioxanivorans]|uniref:Uncharacterized protein n=1 Tax=Xanthobacter dioxanivorans TaxID=2528964 RepID=A0A974PMM1_9HYPH|nr:hypothetical protein [Xanthobacter dioxanivorans]QRG06093.1 hypothetical protein EZH22_24385 [Xanthobacter dioxanivorans]
MDAFTPGPGAVASMLPGAGIVQGNEDFQRGRAALGEGRYGQAAADYGIGMVNAGTDMVPMFAALPPLVVKSANMPPIVRSSERGMVRSEAPWKKGEDFRLTGVSTNKVPPDENPYNAQSMDPVIGVPVQAHHNVDDVLAGLAEVYDSGRGLPPNVENGDYGSFAKWLDDPAVRALVEKRIGEARGADLIPQDADSDLWVALHAQRNPRSGWARWLGPDAPPERRAEIEQRAREMDAAERARSEELGKRGAAFDAYMAAGNMPPSPHGAAAWKAANPGRAPTYFQYDDATGNWSVSDTPYPKGNR